MFSSGKGGGCNLEVRNRLLVKADLLKSYCHVPARNDKSERGVTVEPETKRIDFSGTGKVK